MGQLGVGVMINMLGGNEKTVKTIRDSLGKTIKEVCLSGDALHFQFEDETKIKIFDDGQSCCEHRYMVTDDDLSVFSGEKFIDVELKSAPNIQDENEEHEVQFLEIKTDKGSFVMATHNEHNGYYGGFSVVAVPE